MALNYNDEIKIANYGKPDFNFSEKDLAMFDAMQNAVEAYEKHRIEQMKRSKEMIGRINIIIPLENIIDIEEVADKLEIVLDACVGDEWAMRISTEEEDAG